MLPDVSEVKKRRKALNLTQGALAKLAGASQSFVAKMERGRADPAYSLAKRVFDALEAMESRAEKRAKDLMNPRVVSVSRRDKINKAVRLIRSKGISQLPVFDDKGHCIGSVSEGSVLEKVEGLAKGKGVEALEKKEVDVVIGEPFPLIDENTPQSLVASLLTHHLAVLVQRRGRIVGIITKSDLLK
jgi:predicted transcriptional regulator